MVRISILEMRRMGRRLEDNGSATGNLNDGDAPSVSSLKLPPVAGVSQRLERRVHDTRRKP